VQVEDLMNNVVALLGAELSEDDRDGLVPWVFGLVGGCFYAVRRWTTRDRIAPPVEAFVELMTDAMWFQIDGLAVTRGIQLPDMPVEELLAGLDGDGDGEAGDGDGDDSADDSAEDGDQ
jgi:hypothetical protein